VVSTSHAQRRGLERKLLRAEREESRVRSIEIEGDVKLWTGLDEATSKPEICGEKEKIPS
jgi:hypothetical protein